MYMKSKNNTDKFQFPSIGVAQRHLKLYYLSKVVAKTVEKLLNFQHKERSGSSARFPNNLNI